MIDLTRLQKVSGIIGTSNRIRQVLEMINQVSDVDISVLITGESGTGKEVVAKAIHKNSKRSKSSLVILNCGAIPEGIIESECGYIFTNDYSYLTKRGKVVNVTSVFIM